MPPVTKNSFPRQIARGLWAVGHSYFHHYIVKGEHLSVLIEAGISATADEVIRQLQILKVKPDMLVVTHPHGDHLNGLPALRDAFPQASVIAGPGAQEFAAHPKNGLSFIHDDRFMSAFLQKEGVSNHRPPLSVAPTLEGCLRKENGDIVDLGGLRLVFHTAKGHAPGSLVVEIPELKALIVSDSLGFHYSQGRYFPVYFTGYADYMATIDFLSALGAEIVGLGHQTVFTGQDVAGAFYLGQSNARDLMSRIIADTRPAEMIEQELFSEYYREELRLYSPENIMGCCRLLVRRSREAQTGG